MESKKNRIETFCIGNNQLVTACRARSRPLPSDALHTTIIATAADQRAPHTGVPKCAWSRFPDTQQYCYAWYRPTCNNAGPDTDTDSTDCDEKVCDVHAHYALHTAQCWLHVMHTRLQTDQLIVSDAECFDSVFFTFHM